MIYKCKKCGFKDLTIGIQAHLVLNKCGKIDGFDLKNSNLLDYADIMTQQQFDKEWTAEQEKLVKERAEKLKNEGKPVIKEETTINKEGKTVTKGGFIVEKEEQVKVIKDEK